MKKVLLLVLSLCSLFLLAGCSKGDNGQAFIGTWQSVGQGQYKYVFSRDGNNISYTRPDVGIAFNSGPYDSADDALVFVGNDGKTWELKIEKNGELFMGDRKTLCEKTDDTCIKLHTYKKISN